MSITANGEKVDLKNCTVAITVQRSDGKVNISNCTIKDPTNGIVEYALTNKDTCIVGVSYFTLEIFSSDGRVTTQKCKYMILQELGGDNAVIADDSYPVLDSLIKQVQTLVDDGSYLYCMVGNGGVNKFKIVYISDYDTVITASSNNITHCRKVLGFATDTLTEGEQLKVKTRGKIVNTNWTLIPGDVYFLGLGGEITNTPPTVGFIQQVGMAKNSTTLMVQLCMPIKIIN